MCQQTEKCSTNLGLFLHLLLVGSVQWQAIFASVSASAYSSFSSSPSSTSSDQLSSKYFQVKPSDVYVIEGENAELKCQISSNSDAGPVQWAKDGFLLGYQPIIPGYDRYVMSVNETSRTYNLHIANAQLEDEAEFECQTTSGGGGFGSGASSTSAATKQPIRAAANLHLIVSPKSILINSSRSFDNPVYVPNANYPFPSNESSRGFSSSNRTFHSHSSSNTFIIDAHEAEKIVIVCSVSLSKPPPRLKWYRKNIELLPEAAKTTVSKTLLSSRHTLFSVESSLVLYPKSDEEYKCQVEHAGLSKPLRATAQISIYRSPSSPVIEGYKSGDIVSFQEKLTLKCTSANGYPPPTVVWLRNGVEVDRNSTQSRSGTEMVNTLSFVVQQTDNLATFTCQVANLMTPIPLQQSITLNVLLFPTQVQIIAPTEVLLVGPQGTPVLLQCQAYPASPLPNESKIRWYIDDREVNLEEGAYQHVVKHDQQSWTLRSNLTFVVNNKEPSVRNIGCIVFSTRGKSERISASHQISVIYPPEVPTLLGVKNGLATVHAGDIFKCKCVSYSGNPRASLVWLNHQNREISAVTTTTGSGISSELVIRPSSSDHGAVFRCHVLHPALLKPYEVSFALQVLFAPEQLNITFPKFIKENDTIKIECTASPSNPCPTITLLKDDQKMDGDTNAIMEKIAADGSYTVRQRHWQKEPLQQDMPVAEELAASEEEEEAQESALGPDGRRRGQSVRRHAASGKTDCAPLHNNASNYGPVGMRRSVKAVVSVAVRAEDDGSQITCLASSSLIPGRAIRTEKRLVVHYKPKFNSHIVVVEVSEQASQKLSVPVRANPFVDNLVFSRVKETTPNYTRRLAATDTASATSASRVNALIDDFENISWLVESVPSRWTFSLSLETISLHIDNATITDGGLYMARVSNTLGDSLFFLRLHVKMVSSINLLQLLSSTGAFASSSSMLANQSVPLIREGDKYFRLECRVTANPSITVQWTKETFSYRARGPSAEGSSTSSKEASHNFKERPSIDWSRSNLSQSLVPNLSARPDTGAHTVVSVLLVHEVSYVDAGLYTCVTPNDTKQIQVPIEHYPRIMSGINARKVAADGATPSVKFVCSAVAYPISHFNWTVNGNGMVSGASSVNGRPSGVSDKYSVTSRHGLGTHGSSTSNSEMSSYHFTSELIIRDVNEADFGQYECIAFNQMGTDRATFELVQKSFPESPFNLRAINVTHNSAFLIWDTGFDYGHEQTFQLRLWQLDSELLGQLEKTAESEHSQLLVSRLSRTLANLSVPHCPVGNLEPNIYYRIAVFASNRMGDSPKSAYLTIHTSAVPSYPLKPVYASADEQRLNGLIGNTIIVGEDFLEISVILCLILLLVVSLSTSTFIYCRRRSNRRHQEKALSSSSASSDQTHSFDEPRRSTCEESPFGHSHNPTDCVGPDNLPTASSTLSNQLTMPGLCSEHTGNSLSTTSSYLVKDDYASSYCRTLGLLPTSNFDCQYADKSKVYSDYMTFAPMNLSTGIPTEPAGMYPFELTGGCSVNGKNADDKANYDNGNIRLLLPHQQITNVHLLPETLASESICLNRGSSPLTDGYISFASMPFDAGLQGKLEKTGNLCSLPLSSFELTPQYSLDSTTASTSPGNLTADSASSYTFTIPGSFANSGGNGTAEYPLSASPNCLSHGSIDLYELDSNMALPLDGNQSLDPSLKSKAIKRVNLVKTSNSSIAATLTTLNEEDEV